MSEAETTTNHEVIREWAEERGGKPTTVRATAKPGEAGLLRIDFDPPNEDLEQISWEQFFRKFDEENLVFLYQEETQDGSISRFHKFVERETAEQARSR